MVLSMVRLLVGVVLAIAIGGGALAAPAHAATTWNVVVGGESADHALQVQAFLPTSITINQDDTITWTMGAAFVHTVTFLSGGPVPPEPIPAGEDNLLMLNPQNAFPVGGPNYDGTGFVGSGLIDAKGKTFSLTFTKAGTYGYVCVLHPGMAGQVVVQAVDSAYPMTQAQIDAQANAELYAKLGQGNQQLQGAQLKSQANSDGTTTYTVINGVGGNQSSVLRFLPGDVTVKAGDSVAFPVDDPHEIHTVTFYDPAGAVPPFVTPKPEASGPPKLIIPHAMPQGGSRVEDPKALYNSGIVAPGQSFTFTFPKAGVYSYVCVIHAPQGMFGKVVVEAAGSPGTPASLPNTGEGTPASPLPLLGGALLLLLGGALLRGLWRRPPTV
jgi:LPXTG-motif cell wall-anchored protein